MSQLTNTHKNTYPVLEIEKILQQFRSIFETMNDDDYMDEDFSVIWNNIDNNIANLIKLLQKKMLNIKKTSTLSKKTDTITKEQEMSPTSKKISASNKKSISPKQKINSLTEEEEIVYPTPRSPSNYSFHSTKKSISPSEVIEREKDITPSKQKLIIKKTLPTKTIISKKTFKPLSNNNVLETDVEEEIKSKHNTKIKTSKIISEEEEESELNE